MFWAFFKSSKLLIVLISSGMHSRRNKEKQSSDFQFYIRKKDKTPTKDPGWIFPSFCFVILWKIVKAKRVVFRLILTSFHELIYVREMKVHCSGNFPFQSHWARNINCRQGLWTTDWHNSQCTLFIRKKLI